MSGTDEFAEWYDGLAEAHQDGLVAAVEMLGEHGPRLGRPRTDRIEGSKHHNMKELRPPGAAKNLSVLFMFGPHREAILLVGGDKGGQWNSWYKTAIPEAERLYERYLGEIGAANPRHTAHE